jgi:hypothetical protein
MRKARTIETAFFEYLEKLVNFSYRAIRQNWRGTLHLDVEARNSQPSLPASANV